MDIKFDTSEERNHGLDSKFFNVTLGKQTRNFEQMPHRLQGIRPIIYAHATRIATALRSLISPRPAKPTIPIHQPPCFAIPLQPACSLETLFVTAKAIVRVAFPSDMLPRKSLSPIVALGLGPSTA